jgi:hypothetical protein
LNEQIKIDFDRPAGEALAKAGMELAVETANAEHPNWKDRCWQLFFAWLSRKPRYFEFMVEDFRRYLYDYDLIEKPKSDRAFGFISTQARKRDLILWVRMDKVKNKKAHATPANVWMKK